MSRRHALNAEISACENELRYLGAERVGGETVVVDFTVRYDPAIFNSWESSVVKRITGQDLFLDELSRLLLQIRFDDLLIPVALIFSNRLEWICSDMTGLGGGTIDWTTFLKYARDRPQKINAKLKSFFADMIDLTVESYGPYESDHGDDITDSVIVDLSFRPR